MNDNKWDWVEEQEKKMGGDYFNIQEGKNQFVLLSHCAPLAQVFDPATKKYRIAEEGDKNVSIKGLCWVLQDNVIKSAKLPYTVVKQIRELRENPDWEFTVPFPYMLTLTAKNAGTKEVEYTLSPSPKQVEVPAEVMEELAKKPTPEEMVEKIKGKVVSPGKPDEELNPDDIPFSNGF